VKHVENGMFKFCCRSEMFTTIILGSYCYQKVPQVFQSLIKVISGDVHDMSALVMRKPLPMRQVDFQRECTLTFL
jgi:hypothetical protein